MSYLAIVTGIYGEQYSRIPRQQASAQSLQANSTSPSSEWNRSSATIGVTASNATNTNTIATRLQNVISYSQPFISCGRDYRAERDSGILNVPVTLSVVNNIAEKAENFAHAGRRYCSTVDAAPKYERAEFLLKIYRVLPVLIGEAMGLPNAELSETSGESEEPSSRMPQEAWAELYESLKQKLDDWNEYRKVFDPTSGDTESIYGSLADDLADIYRDVQEGLLLRDAKQACWEEVVFNWRFSFYSHWGKHAIDALEVIHCRLSVLLM